MKPEAQQIAIAEACGYSATPNQGNIGGFIGRNPNGNSDYYAIGHNWADAIKRICPEYLSDLNAMHEAEKALSPANQPARGESQWSEYLGWLGFCGENETREVYGCVTATAAQRAEAFLRTIGKWEGE